MSRLEGVADTLYINYGSLPYTDFIRTKTLRQGGDLCDFLFIRHETDAGDGWERKEWLMKLAIPEHALGWTFLVCPIAGLIVAGIAVLFAAI